MTVPPGGPVAVGLVGAGPWAQQMHAPVLAAGPETRLVAVWARRADAAAELAARHGAVAAGSYEELLDRCEAVALAVPPDVQEPLAVQAARAGRGLLLEKPLGLDLASARRVADAVREAGVPHLLVLSRRFLPETASFLASAAALRAAGPVTGVRGAYLSGAFLGGPYATPWRLAHGALLDLGPHLVDLVEAAVGPVRSVAAAGDPRAVLAVTTEHDGGVGSLLLSGAVTGHAAVVELLAPHGRVEHDADRADPAQAWPVMRRRLAAAVRSGVPDELDVTRGLALQVVLDAVTRSLAADGRRVRLD